jgi:hypothetical protein
MPDTIPTSTLPIAPLPVVECAILLPLLELPSTPLISSAAFGRFEYPFPIIQPLLFIPLAPLATTPSSVQTLPNGSIVPPTGTGRGMDMSSFASFSPYVPTVPLPYPSATASASQALDQMLLLHALPADMAAVYTHNHYTAAQLCMLASANSPVPPSLALKRRGLNLGGRERPSVSDGQLGPGIDDIPKV